MVHAQGLCYDRVSGRCVNGVQVQCMQAPRQGGCHAERPLHLMVPWLRGELRGRWRGEVGVLHRALPRNKALNDKASRTAVQCSAVWCGAVRSGAVQCSALPIRASRVVQCSTRVWAGCLPPARSLGDCVDVVLHLHHLPACAPRRVGHLHEHEGPNQLRVLPQEHLHCKQLQAWRAGDGGGGGEWDWYKERKGGAAHCR